MKNKRELIGEKLRAARKVILSLEQTDLSKLADQRQAGISRMEMGKFEYLSVDFLSWLAEHGVDLTGIFDSRISTQHYISLAVNKSEGHTRIETEEIKSLKQQLEAKDQIISDLRFTIDLFKSLQSKDAP